LASRRLDAKFYGLGLEGPGLGLGLESCIDNISASPSNSRPDNYSKSKVKSYNNKLITSYKNNNFK